MQHSDYSDRITGLAIWASMIKMLLTPVSVGWRGEYWLGGLLCICTPVRYDPDH